MFAQLNGDDGKFVLSDSGKELKLDGNAYIIFEPFTLNPNVSRTVFNKLIASLKAAAFDDEHLNETNDLMAQINRFTADLLDSLNYSFEVTAGDGFAVEDLLKALKPQIELPTSTLPEKLVDYLAALRDLFNIKLFVLINFSAYLSREDMLKLVNQIAYDGHFALFIESRFVDLGVPHVAITKELCEL
jgi:CRISPR type II-A-associated protein Csn2